MLPAVSAARQWHPRSSHFSAEGGPVWPRAHPASEASRQASWAALDAGMHPLLGKLTLAEIQFCPMVSRNIEEVLPFSLLPLPPASPQVCREK